MTVANVEHEKWTDSLTEKPIANNREESRVESLTEEIKSRRIETLIGRVTIENRDETLTFHLGHQEF